MPISVLIADAHPVVREGVKAVLSRGFRVVGACGDGHELLRMVARHKPQVVITDIPLPHLNGLAVALQISREHKESKVIILSALDGATEIWHASMAKVAGYLVKSEAIETLADSVQRIAEGENVFSPTVEAYLRMWGHFLGFGETHLEGLTTREVEVCQLVKEGCKNQAIASILELSMSRVKRLLESIKRKLKLQGDQAGVRLQIALFAMRAGNNDWRTK